MTLETYPDAYLRMDGQSGGSYLNAPWRVVIHTTETVGTPGYDDGKSSPHVTYNPKTRIFVQHTPFTTACRALRNLEGGVQTNRNNALQLEIVCYSDKSVADERATRLWVGDLPDTAYTDIATFLKTLTKYYNFNFKLIRIPRPKPRFGYDSPARMGEQEWNEFNGLCGHFEVPEQTHWDPGAFSFERLIAEMEKLMEPETPEAPHIDQVSKWAKPSWIAAWKKGIVLDGTYPQHVMTKEEFMVFLDRLGLLE